ncbi:hypothetical protein [Cellvibrio polysaccharolyticus]|nr:hypothetical protein [Cellvibrio polysaccharolyticus]
MRTLITFVILMYCTFANAAAQDGKHGDENLQNSLSVSEGDQALLQPVDHSGIGATQELVATISAFGIRLFEALIIFAAALIEAVVIFLGAVIKALIVFLVAL